MKCPECGWLNSKHMEPCMVDVDERIAEATKELAEENRILREQLNYKIPGFDILMERGVLKAQNKILIEERDAAVAEVERLRVEVTDLKGPHPVGYPRHDILMRDLRSACAALDEACGLLRKLHRRKHAAEDVEAVDAFLAKHDKEGT